MKIIAHRGGSAGTSENTLAAFRQALEIGVDGIELDIHVSADGVPVVIHDGTLDRTTTGTGRVDSFTLEELQQFDAGDGERIPTLEAVLSFVGGQVPFILELKSLEAVGPASAVIRQHPDVRWAGLSGIPAALDALRVEFPEGELCVGTLGSREGAERLIDLLERAKYPASGEFLARVRKDAETFTFEDVFTRAAELNATKIGVYWESITPEMVASVHERGFQIGAWTVNDPVAAEQLMRMGIDTLTSDDPATMRRLVDETSPVAAR